MLLLGFGGWIGEFGIYITVALFPELLTTLPMLLLAPLLFGPARALEVGLLGKIVEEEFVMPVPVFPEIVESLTCQPLTICLICYRTNN